MADTLVVVSVSAPPPAIPIVPLPTGVNPPTLTGGEVLQRIDMEIIDGSGSRNVYQAKKGIKGETRMAITTHADADLGVCFSNVLHSSERHPPFFLLNGNVLLTFEEDVVLCFVGIPASQAHLYQRSIDLDVDIGADAVDYNAIAKQESLSGLEVEMRKLEGVVKEIVEELNYLKRREVRMRDTNGECDRFVRST